MRVLDDSVTRNSYLQGLLAAGPKPSFLLWDKVYQKLNDPEDEKWLVRAAEAAFVYHKDELKKSVATR